MEEEKVDSVRENILAKNDLQSRRNNVRWNYGIEPAVFLLYFAFYLTTAILQNQILKQMCLQLGYSLNSCSNLNTDNVTKAIEEEVQPYVADINSSILLLNSIFPAVLCFLLGSWTDKFGRKKVLMMSFSGYASTLGLIMLISYISDNIKPLSPWYYFVAEIPMCLMGGWPTLDVALCCYVTDLSDEKNRSFRLGAIGFLNFLGSFTALISSSFILEATNASTVFIISFTLCMTAFIYTIFFVDESIRVDSDVSGFDQFKAIFSYKRAKEVFSTLFIKRSFKERRIIWCLIATQTLAVFTMHGNGTVNYLFVREKFQWALRQWTIFDATNTAINVFGLFTGVAILKNTASIVPESSSFKKFFQISDMRLALVAITSAIIDSVFKAFATKSYHLYIASGIGVLRLLSTPVFRSIMSTVIPHSEVGKAYSATSSFEALSGLGAGPLYTTIYKATYTTFPGAFHLITATAFMIAFILGLMVSHWKKARDFAVNQYRN